MINPTVEYGGTGEVAIDGIRMTHSTVFPAGAAGIDSSFATIERKAMSIAREGRSEPCLCRLKIVAPPSRRRVYDMAMISVKPH